MCQDCRPSDTQPPHLLPSSPVASTTSPHPNLHHHLHTSISGAGGNTLTPSLLASRSSIHGGGGGCGLLSGVSQPQLGYTAPFNSSGGAVESPTRSDSPTDIFTRSNSKADHWMDGVCLSDSGMIQIKTMTLEPIRQRRNHPPKFNRPVRGPSLDSCGSRGELDDDEEGDEDGDGKEGGVEEPKHWVYGLKEGAILQAQEDGSPPVLPEGFYTHRGHEPGVFILRKRRYRNIKTLGIGGFQAETAAQVRSRLKRDEERAREEAQLDPKELEAKRKRSHWRTKKKIKLLEKFPAYIQEAFFGRNLMDTTHMEETSKVVDEMENVKVEKTEETVMPGVLLGATTPTIRLNKDELDLMKAALDKQHQQVTSQQQQQKLKQENDNKPPSTVASTSSTNQRNIVKNVSAAKEEQKEEDLGDADEAIEALFGGGRNLLTDDIIGDFMDAEISHEEEEDGDLKEEANTPRGAAPKLTDILGPAFNLDDVADIMKSLPDEALEDGSSAGVVTSSGGVVGMQTSGSGEVANISANSSVVTQSGSGMPMMIGNSPANSNNPTMVSTQGQSNMPGGNSHPQVGMIPPQQVQNMYVPQPQTVRAIGLQSHLAPQEIGGGLVRHQLPLQAQQSSSIESLLKQGTSNPQVSNIPFSSLPKGQLISLARALPSVPTPVMVTAANTLPGGAQSAPVSTVSYSPATPTGVPQEIGEGGIVVGGPSPSSGQPQTVVMVSHHQQQQRLVQHPQQQIGMIQQQGPQQHVVVDSNAVSFAPQQQRPNTLVQGGLQSPMHPHQILHSQQSSNTQQIIQQQQQQPAGGVNIIQQTAPGSQIVQQQQMVQHSGGGGIVVRTPIGGGGIQQQRSYPPLYKTFSEQNTPKVRIKFIIPFMKQNIN